MSSPAEIPLAIVGLSCRLPGADNLDAYWDLLTSGLSAWGEMPESRFDRALYFDPEPGKPTKSYTTLGSLVSEIPFDRDRCPLPAELVARSHPVHLALAEVTADAFRSAGQDPFALPAARSGVYVGHTPPSGLLSDVVVARLIEGVAPWLLELEAFRNAVGEFSPQILSQMIQEFRAPYETAGETNDPRLTMRGNAHHAAAILTEGFGLDGPSMAFDAACASSLRALAHGARALQLGQIDQAVICGASYLHSDTLVLFSQARSLSKSGSRPFDDEADGLVAAEGFVTLILKTLDRALRDEDDVWAVIRGIGLSSDGKGKSLWAPRKEGQIEAIRRAYPAGVSPATLDYLEMHATSTQLGDATEVDAFTTVLKDDPPSRKIPIGSVKANIGHSLEVAGLASLAKAVLTLRHGVIPPQANVRSPSRKIPWETIPFRLPTQQEPLNRPSGSPSRVAVNAFGIGGLNVHVVLEAHDASYHAGILQSHPAPEETLPEPIAIIGAGAVVPGGNDLAAVQAVLQSPQSQLKPLPTGRWPSDLGVSAAPASLWRVPCSTGGFITDFEYDWKKNRVPPKHVKHADPLQFMLLDSADQAWHDAGFADGSAHVDTRRSGVIVGSIFAGEFANELAVGLRLPRIIRVLSSLLAAHAVAAPACDAITSEFQTLVLQRLSALIDETGSFTASTQASRISKALNLMGGAVALDSGDASGVAALASAIDLLRGGDCDVMLCAAGHRALDKATYEYMWQTGRLSKDGDVRPFNEESSGCVPGEGAVAVVLKRLADAQRDGNRIHAVIGPIQTRRRRQLEESVAAAVNQATAANIASDVFATTATGVPAEDQAIARGIEQGLPADSEETSTRLTGVSARLGHTGGLSGLLETLHAIVIANSGECVFANAVHMFDGNRHSKPQDSRQRAEAAVPIFPASGQGRLHAGVVAFNEAGVAYHVSVVGTKQSVADTKLTSKPVAQDFVKADGSCLQGERTTNVAAKRYAMLCTSATLGFESERSRAAAVAVNASRLAWHRSQLQEQSAAKGTSPEADRLLETVATMHAAVEAHGDPFAIVADATSLPAALVLTKSWSFAEASLFLLRSRSADSLVKLMPPCVPLLFMQKDEAQFLAEPQLIIDCLSAPPQTSMAGPAAIQRLSECQVTKGFDVHSQRLLPLAEQLAGQVLVAKPTSDAVPDSTPTSTPARDTQRRGSASIEWIELQGSPREMGRQHGKRFAADIREQLQTSTAVGQLLNTDVRAHFPLPHDAEEELQGLAAGAGVDTESLLAFNIALWEMQTAIPAETSPPAEADHFAVTWQHGASLVPEDDFEDREFWAAHYLSHRVAGDAFERPLRYVWQHRIPEVGNTVAGLAVAGQIGLLAGINSRGLAVSKIPQISWSIPQRATEAAAVHPEDSPQTACPLHPATFTMACDLLTACDDLHTAHWQLVGLLASTKNEVAQRHQPVSIGLSDLGQGLLRYCEYDGDRVATVPQVTSVAAGIAPRLTARERSAADILSAQRAIVREHVTSGLRQSLPQWCLLRQGSTGEMVLKLKDGEATLPFACTPPPLSNNGTAISEAQAAEPGRSAAGHPSAVALDRRSARFALVDDVLAESATCLVTETLLDPAGDQFLKEHRFKGQPLLPAVVALELAVSTALLAIDPASDRLAPLQIDNMELLTGVRFHSNHARPLRGLAERDENGWRCCVQAAVVNRKNQVLRPHEPGLRARIGLSTEESREQARRLAPEHETSEIQADDSFPIWYYENGLAIYHGPVFRTLESLQLQNDRAWGSLRAPNPRALAPRRQHGDWRLPAALLDGCFFACGSYSWMTHGQAVAIPAGLDKLLVFASPEPETPCHVSLRFRGREENYFLFDFHLQDSQQRSVLIAEGYRSIIVSEPLRSASRVHP